MYYGLRVFEGDGFGGGGGEELDYRSGTDEINEKEIRFITMCD